VPSFLLSRNSMTADILPRQVNRRIGRAMHDYGMLSDGDRVLIAVSGGVDSMVLAWLLAMWRAKAPIGYSVDAVNIDAGFWRPDSGTERPTDVIASQMNHFNIEFFVEKKDSQQDVPQSCFACARQRRTRLFELARERGYTKIALGHHKDDLVETLFLNMLYSGNISTMVPRQDLFEGRLALIRPMAYLEKSEIRQIARRVGIRTVENLCPLAGDTRRETVRKVLDTVYKEVPGAKSSLFASLANIREEYILKKDS
jgi:tRNA 2-thiocytidine biosynthesis protein TtcA